MSASNHSHIHCVQTGPSACLPTANAKFHALDPSNRVATPNPQRPGRQKRPPSCANSHNTRHTAKHVVVTPGLPTAFTMAARRTSRAAAKRAQQALGTSFFRVFSYAACSTPRSIAAVLSRCISHTPSYFGLFCATGRSRHEPIERSLCSSTARTQGQSRQLRGSA